MQIFLRYDRSLTLDVHPADSVAGVKDAIASKTGLPADDVRLICAGKLLQDARTLAEHGVANHATVHLVLGLRGGKGGFGAMLRTAGARGVKTTNFDACRDLNGRRLRHINAEARLREWDATAEERKLKKQQEAAAAAAGKPTGPPPIARFDDDEYEEMLEVCAHSPRLAWSLSHPRCSLCRPRAHLPLPCLAPAATHPRRALSHCLSQGTRNRVSDALAAGLASASSADGAGSSSGGGSAGGGDAAATAGDAGGSAQPPTHTKAEGKRKAVDPPPATDEPAPAKAAKLNTAFDPLQMLGGDEDDDDDDDDEEEAAGAE